MADNTILNPVNPVIANNLTNEGYKTRTAQEWQEIIVNAMQTQNPDFALNPADLQSDLINTSIQKIMQFEQLTALMLNAYSTGFNNNMIFRKFAESIGLAKNPQSNSSVLLTFTGQPYTYIPQDTICSNENNTIQLQTTDALVLDSTGKGNVTAETSDSVDIEPHTINNIVNLNIDELSVDNLVNGSTGLPQESDEDLKLRTQAIFRSPRRGGIDYAINLLKSGYNINSRLINIQVIDNYIFTNGTTQQAGVAIHSIIGGGNNNEVAKVLFTCFLETQKLVSLPSNNETERSVNVVIKYFNSNVNIAYTIPKELKIDINVYLMLSNLNYSPSLIYGFINETIINYINNLQVGTQLNKLTLSGLILPQLNNNNINNNQINYIDYTFALNGINANVNSSGFIENINIDNYLTLNSLNVYLSQIPTSKTTTQEQQEANK